MDAKIFSRAFASFAIWAFALSNHHVQSQEEQAECGKQLVRGGRIVGGEEAYDGEFPFMVSIRLGGITYGQHHCGGVILRKRWILTAGHCVNTYPMKFFTVRIGEYDLTKPETNHTNQDIPLEQIVLHPQLFEPKRYTNDIALLKLKKPIRFNNYAWPACLPDEDQDFTGRKAIVSGWGWTKEPGQGGRRSPTLQKVQLPVMNGSQCQELYDEAQRKVKFEKGQMCAGFKAGEKDSCQGDSGGPLVVREQGSFKVIGVVSAGIGCARPLLPGVYTRVSDYIPWILETMDSPLPETNEIESEEEKVTKATSLDAHFLLKNRRAHPL